MEGHSLVMVLSPSMGLDIIPAPKGNGTLVAQIRPLHRPLQQVVLALMEGQFTLAGHVLFILVLIGPATMGVGTTYKDC